MTKKIFLIVFSLYCGGCAGMQVRRSGFDQSGEAPPFFQLLSASKYREAYALLCPIVRNATDFKVFESTLGANPFVRQIGNLILPESESIYGSDSIVLTGWLSSVGTTVPIEMTVATQENTRCLLAVTILGSSILPPYELSDVAQSK